MAESKALEEFKLEINQVGQISAFKENPKLKKLLEENRIQKAKLKELSNKVKFYEEETNKREFAVKEIKAKIASLDEEVKKSKATYDNDRKCKEKLESKLVELKTRKLRAEQRLTKTDMLFMDSLKMKLKAYNYSFCIIWDLEKCNENFKKGYIRNPVNNRLKSFELETGVKPIEEFEDYFWEMLDEIFKECRKDLQ